MSSAHPDFWKVRAAWLAKANVELSAERAVQQARAQLVKVMTDAGLDPAKSYTMDEQAETIIEQPHNATPTAPTNE